MCGESNAGKSALVLRFSGNQFTHSFTSTIGVDFRNEQVMVEGQQVQLQIWDTAGQVASFFVYFIDHNLYHVFLLDDRIIRLILYELRYRTPIIFKLIGLLSSFS